MARLLAGRWGTAFHPKVTWGDAQHMIDRGWDLYNLVVRKGRRDIAKATEHSLKRSLRLQRWSDIAHSSVNKPFVWRWAGRLERMVLAGSIH